MAGRRSLYDSLSEKYKKLVDRFVKSLEGYRPSSVDTYKRKAVKYLLFCQERGLDFRKEKTLEFYRKKAGGDDYTRAKFFVKRMQEIGFDWESEETREQETVKQVDDSQNKEEGIADVLSLKILEKRLRRIESLIASLQEEKAEQKSEKSEILIGKPVRVRKLNGEVVKGEVKFIDEDFLYVLVIEEKKGEKVLKPRKFADWREEQMLRQEVVLKVIPKDVIETLEVPAELLDL